MSNNKNTEARMTLEMSQELKDYFLAAVAKSPCAAGGYKGWALPVLMRSARATLGVSLTEWKQNNEQSTNTRDQAVEHSVDND